MADTSYLYPGSDFGLDPNYGLEGTGEYGNFTGYRADFSDIGYPTDATTANQLDVVSKKLSTGTKVVEVSGLGIAGGGGAMAHMDKIPKQQWKEIERLKKLAGAELTFHGPLVEPTGVSRQGWDETQRQQAEREMWAAIKRGQQMESEGNLVVTFHASNGLPEPETTVIDEKTGKPKTTQMYFVDEREGRFVAVGPPTKDYLSKDPKTDIMNEIKKENEESWFRELQHVNFNAYAGLREIEEVKKTEKEYGKKGAIFDVYKEYIEDPKESEKYMKKLEPDQKELMEHKMRNLTHSDIYYRDAYQGLKKLFNQSYEAAEKNNSKKDLELLNKYRKEALPKIESYENNPAKLGEFSDAVIEGVNVLRKIGTPERLIPLRDFAIDKASDTFSNVAFKSYKKFEDKSPIISVENPPMGMGLATGKDLKDLIKETRSKFVTKAKKELGMSEGQAKKQAEKLIGVTWDVGHINMIRKYGYKEKEVVKQTEKVAPYVKHVHLSDNFGIEHTELPMGMGNVPTKKHLELIDKYNKQAKKIVETGDWFSRQGGLSQTQTPVVPTLTALGSPVYGLKMAPYWNQAASETAFYYGGLGATNPQIHHSIYGAGFSNLPIELGGQMGGQSRMGGAPME